MTQMGVALASIESYNDPENAKTGIAMHDLTKLALGYLGDNWHKGLVGTGDAAELLGLNPSTLKTRLSRGQALSLRETDGRQRALVEFTGFHLIFNLLNDHLLRWGVAEADKITLPYAEWVNSHILAGPHFTEAVLRVTQDENGKATAHLYEEGGVEQWTGTSALIVPIGSMVVRLATAVLMKKDGKRAMAAVYGER